MITVEFTEEEAVSLLVAGRAMTTRYEILEQTESESYLRLRVACEKLDLVLWGKPNT